MREISDAGPLGIDDEIAAYLATGPDGEAMARARLEKRVKEYAYRKACDAAMREVDSFVEQKIDTYLALAAAGDEKALKKDIGEAYSAFDFYVEGLIIENREKWIVEWARRRTGLVMDYVDRLRGHPEGRSSSVDGGPALD